MIRSEELTNWSVTIRDEENELICDKKNETIRDEKNNPICNNT